MDVRDRSGRRVESQDEETEEAKQFHFGYVDENRKIGGVV